MLILSRDQGEDIVIGGGLVIVRVCEVRTRQNGAGFRVRLGIEADRSLSVDRLEVYEAKRRGELAPNLNDIAREVAKSILDPAA